MCGPVLRDGDEKCNGKGGAEIPRNGLRGTSRESKKVMIIRQPGQETMTVMARCS